MKGEDSATTDVGHWFGPMFVGCDVPHWLPFMTAEELGYSGPKLTVGFTHPVPIHDPKEVS